MGTEIKRILVTLTLVVGAALSSTCHADLYTGSGTTGFGGPIGQSQMTWTDDGSTVTVEFTKGGGNFNDVFVIYLDTISGGRNVIGTQVNDRADTHRSAISYIEAGAGKSLTFTSGFEADYAIAINAGFGGLWQIPSAGTIGNGNLSFVSSVGNPGSATASSFNFSFDLADIGLTPSNGDSIDFLAVYLNPFGDGNGLGFASNEGYGSGFPAGNIGQNDFTFAGSPLTYVASIPEVSPALIGGLMTSLFGLVSTVRRKR